MPRVYVILAITVPWLSSLACTPDGKPPLHTSKFQGEIGGACGQDSDCHGGGTCMIAKFAAANVAPPGGYCTRTCTGDNDCGTGKCVQDSSDSKFYCMAFCESAGDCRADYLCLLAKHCEPFARYNPTCDPKDNSGVCADGGGCLRIAIGTGTAGVCYPQCSGPTGCSSKSGCYYVDENQLNHDPFQGTVCFNEVGTVAIGGSCTVNSDCVSYSSCITGDHTCHSLCDSPGFGTCSDGADCLEFDPPGPVGACRF
jgi:hypothetical protein